MNTTMFKFVVCDGIVAGSPDLDSIIIIIRAVVILDDIVVTGRHDPDSSTTVRADVVYNCVVAGMVAEFDSIKVVRTEVIV